MRKIEEVLRLHQAGGRSNREIARAVRVSPTTVADYLRRARRAGLSWPLAEGLTERAVEAALFPPTAASRVQRPEPDWAAVHRQLGRSGVTLDLLWQEYRERHPVCHGTAVQFAWNTHKGHQTPWLLLTDLPPEVADAGWYGLRAWIEQGFKKIKGGGWQWHYTRMTDPVRAERLWLTIAIATWWLLTVGGEAEATIPTAMFPAVPGSPRQQGRRWRLVGIFRHGWSLIVAALFSHQPFPIGHGCPEPWPALPMPSDTLSLPMLEGEA